MKATKESSRKLFLKWIKKSSWSVNGLAYTLRQDPCDGTFLNQEVEFMYFCYTAGMRKGIKLAKENHENQ